MSIQGQFYVTWCAVFLLVAAMATPARRSARSIAGWVLVAIVLGSFTFSVVDTSREQAFAYFSTFTRGWEFGVGGLLALVIDRVRLPRAVAAVASWAALAVILGVGLALPVADLFPGWVAALPVGAACVLIATGQLDGRYGASRLLASRPLVWLGGLGYGVYLWHWPVMIFVLHQQGETRAGLATGSAIIIASLVLAWLTRRWVELPVQRISVRGAVRPVATGALAMATVVMAVVAGWQVGALDRASARESLAVALSGCAGAAALDPVHPECALPDREADVLPAVPSRDLSELFETRCASLGANTDVRRCTWGDESSATRVALLGNSHAAVWFTPLRQIAEDRGWRLDTYFKSGCAVSQATRRGIDPAAAAVCDTWNDSLDAELAGSEPYDVVFTSALALARDYRDDDTGLVGSAGGVAGFQRTWQPLIDRGARIIAIRDYPRSSDDLIRCALRDPAGDCARPLTSAVVADGEEILVLAAQQTAGVDVLDMRRWFCVDGRCPAVIGNVHVYRDPAHFTETYARTLVPYFAAELRAQTGL